LRFSRWVHVRFLPGSYSHLSSGSGAAAGIVDSADLCFSVFTAHGAFRFPQVRERRPCAAKRTAYRTTVIAKPFALLLSSDSTITFG
jgi:hypothetical protein